MHIRGLTRVVNTATVFYITGVAGCGSLTKCNTCIGTAACTWCSDKVTVLILIVLFDEIFVYFSGDFPFFCCTVYLLGFANGTKK